MTAGAVHLAAPVTPEPRAADLPPISTPTPGSAASSRPPEHASTGSLAEARVTLRPGPVRVSTDGFFAWSLLDRRSGRIIGSSNLRTPGEALAMVRPWLVADLLRRKAAEGHAPTGSRLRQLRTVVRGDDAAPADALYRELGGAASIKRMVKTCGLSDSRPHGDSWSSTIVSAQDTVRMGACLADGRAAGTRWTSWLLAEMRMIRGTGDFGARKALPAPVAATVAIRNGWLLRHRERHWHVGCLAVDRDWVLGVLARYPEKLGLSHGARLCASVATQLRSR